MRLQSEVKEWFGQKTSLPATGRIHFVGIGGAGMSALARILLRQGREVSGSDLIDSPTTDLLREHGADIYIGHSATNLTRADIVVVSDAIDLSENPETIEAKRRNLLLFRRSQLLGALLQGYRVLAVTGSHGKSTTTAILAQILEKAGLDPLAIVGADVPGFEGNVRLGRGDIAVVEACEAYDSFHDITPELVLLTNLEPEHLDYHKSWENLRDSVVRFVKCATGKHRLVYCSEDSGACEVASAIGDGIAYGFDELGAQYKNGSLLTKNGSHPMKIIGRHNALNALGAIATAKLLGVDEREAFATAASASGCKRRLEKIGDIDGTTVYDDYAHHPTEIVASIDALKEAHLDKKLCVVFQPHLYSRTKDQLEGFANALSGADIVFLTDIYPARERPIPGISSALIVEKLEAMGTDTFYVASRHLLPREVAANANSDMVVVGMGAGNIESFAPDFLVELKRKNSPLRVAVFGGGESVEREVSILSATMVANALMSKGYSVQTIDPTELLLHDANLSALIGAERPDIVFLALHGTGAEDGAIQGLLELLHLPYTGSGIMASALAMDKEQTKRLLESRGLPTPAGVTLKKGDPIPEFPVPCVVKPNAQGSTIGLTFVQTAADLKKAVEKALKYDDIALIEEFISGIEISVPILGETALPAVEICPKSGTYDFAAKYTPGETEEIVPARISKNAEKTAREYARIAHNAIGAKDFSRTDLIVAGDKIVVLEINTLPGLTQTSLLPKSADSAGISYADLCENILQSAMKRYGIEKK